MKNSIKTLIALTLLAGIIFTGVQSVAAAGEEKPFFSGGSYILCTDKGGSWSGVPFATEGTCIFLPGTTGHTESGACTENQSLGWTVVGDIIVDTYCIGSATSGGPGYGKCGNEARKTDDPVMVNTCYGTSVFFAEGACAGKCTVGPKVLNTAKKGLSQLDGEALGEAYVKVRNPGGGSYKICFPGEGTIYRWVNGAWVAQPTQMVNGVSCAWGSGDGNYVLVAE